ncbi:MAG TPA: nuclear transport factor 2 family protein [Polyangiaceae bacterium]|nr:nuclear transport factor 2 family protein [Polyangiaceae bacterium]
MKRSLLLGFIAAVVGAAIYVLFFGDSDESRIRDRLDQLAAAVRIDEDELSPLPRAGRIRTEFTDIFTKDATASVAEIDDTFEGRDAMAAAAVQIASVYRSADVSFDNVKVRIDEAAAEVKTTALVTGARHGQGITRDELPVILKLKKMEGDWKLVSAVVELRRDPRE